MGKISLDKLTPVTKNYSKGGQKADIRFSQTQEKFFVREQIMHDLKLQDNGLTLYYDQEQQMLFLSVQPNEDSVMFRGRKDYETKSEEFASSEFVKTLTRFGWMPEDEEEDLYMNLEKVDEVEGVPYYQLLKVNEQGERVDPNDVVEASGEQEASEQAQTEATPQQSNEGQAPETQEQVFSTGN